MATVLYVELDSVDKSSLALGATVVLKTINQGHCTFVTVLNNHDQSLNGLYDSQDVAYIKMGGADILKGYIDDVKHVVTHREDVWHHLLRVNGRDYSQDLSNLFLSEIWASAKKADEIVDEALAKVDSEIIYTAPATADTIGGYEPHQIYLMDLIKDVFDRANMEGYVDINKALQAYAIGANSSGLTLTYSDLVGEPSIEYTPKSGLALRNQIYALGELLENTPNDEYTEAITGWTSNGTVSAVGGGVGEGANFIRATKAGSNLYLQRDIDYAVHETGKDEDGNITSSMHFLIRAYGLTGEVTAPVDSLQLALYQDAAGNHKFIYDFTEADIEADLTEFTVGLGIDNEDDWTVYGEPDWAGINLIRLFATTTEDDCFIDIDDLDFKRVNYQGFSEDTTSMGTYRRRMELQQDSQLKSHTQALDLGDSIKEKKKDPLEHIKLVVNGASTISGGNYKLWPGYKVTLNFPKINMTNEVWRVQMATLKCYPHTDLSGHGHDFIATLNCVPQTTKINHLNYQSVVHPYSSHPHVSMEAYKRRANKRFLP